MSWITVIVKSLPYLPDIIKFFKGVAEKKEELSEKASIIPDNIKEGINSIFETIKTVINIENKISTITKEIKLEITNSIEKVQRAIESGITSKIEQIKKDIEVEIDKKIDSTRTFMTSEIIKIKSQIIRFIILLWLIQTVGIIIILALFMR